MEWENDNVQISSGFHDQIITLSFIIQLPNYSFSTRLRYPGLAETAGNITPSASWRTKLKRVLHYALSVKR